MSKPNGSIDIIKNYVMVPDEYQWILYRYSKVKRRDGSTDHEWKTIGFYAGLPQLFTKVIDCECKGCKSIEGIVSKIEELEEFFRDKLEVDIK